MEEHLVKDGVPVYFVRAVFDGADIAWKVPAVDGLTAVALVPWGSMAGAGLRVLSVTPVMVPA